MTDACGAVVPFIAGHTPGVLRCLHLAEQKGMITCFNSQDIVQGGVSKVDIDGNNTW